MDVLDGLIFKTKGADYFVTSQGKEYRCYLRGKFRIVDSEESVLPVVGDRVRFRTVEEAGSNELRGMIVEVLPRKSVLKRADPSKKYRGKIIASNLDQVFIVMSVAQPKPNRRFLDRLIVAAESDSIEPVICVNKMDLATDIEEVKNNFSVYEELGYRVLFTSAETSEGIEQLKEMMRDKLSIMAGPSGAGKTSLIAQIQPGLELKVGSVSERSGKGKHTTTHFELHALDEGGYIGDTPGVREFGIVGLKPNELSDYFREFEKFTNGCKFSPCTHSHEPHCAVKEAVETGKIDRERYESYLRILESLREAEGEFWKR